MPADSHLRSFFFLHSCNSFMLKNKYLSDQAVLYESIGNWWEPLKEEESELSLQPLLRGAGFLTRRAWPGRGGRGGQLSFCLRKRTLPSIAGIMHLTPTISNLKQCSMCCGLYFHLLLKWPFACS